MDMTSADIKARLEKLLSILGTENAGFGFLYHLIDKFGGFDRIPYRDIEAIRPHLRIGLRDNFTGFANVDIKEIDYQINAMNETESCLVFFGDEGYPRILTEIKSPPPFLFIRGELERRDEISIAMVGTRRASSYGRSVAEKISMQLAQSGVTIVSGFAAGIDSISHRAAMDAGGRTIAVLGNGIDVIYPMSNRKLWRELPKNGAMISQFPMGTPPLRNNFPNRNRLISALSLGVLVVEAPEKSGSLITASFALEQNREVFAVPGDINSEKSRGANKLIQKGAKMVLSVNDILDEIGIIKADGEDRPKLNLKELTESQVRIYESLSARPIPVDALSRRIGMAAHLLLSDLSIMELKGFVRQSPGKQFARSI